MTLTSNAKSLPSATLSFFASPIFPNRLRHRYRLFCLVGWLVAITTLEPSVSFAERSDTPTDAASENGSQRLPPLPTVPQLLAPSPTVDEVDELDDKLKRLKASSVTERTEAVRELLDVRPRLIAAALAQFNKLAERTDPERLKRALLTVKDQARGNRRALRDDDKSQDLLFYLVEHANAKDDAVRDLTELVALSRVFAVIGTVDAARGLIEIYVRFGEFTRVDVQNRLYDLKDGAVAALIEARRHKAEKIARWSERQLDRLGKAVPGEAIRTTNYETLADILRAYGRTKDPDAARVVVSYTNSERYQVREAARQAVTLMGEVGLWQLREAYEDVVGKRPRRDFGWERTARELFYEYDRLRIAVVADLFEAGTQALNEAKFEEMGKAYDAVLTRLPQFDRGPTMATGYYSLAQKLQSTNPDEAEAALVRVERLSTDPTLRAHAKSLRDTLVAVKRLQNGVLDTSLLQSAIDRDKANRRANRLLYSLDQHVVETTTNRVRWLTSGAIGLLSLVSIAFIFWRRRPQHASAPVAVEAITSDASSPFFGPSALPNAEAVNLASPLTAPSTACAVDEACGTIADPNGQTELSPATSHRTSDPFEGL